MRPPGDRGFSLVEVLVAMGLLAGVLISVAGLFNVAASRVHSGRCSSEALAVGKAMHEDMLGWGYSQLWRTFGSDGRAATYAVDTRGCAACASWQAALATALGPSAYATIRLDSLSGVGSTVTELADASGRALTKAVRVRVEVHWIETPGRARSVTLCTLRN